MAFKKQMKQKQPHSNRDQKGGYQKGWGGKTGEKGEGNVINNIVVSLYSGKWVLELVGWLHGKV